MDHIEVNSSVIKSVAHDAERKLLEIKFHTGKVYQYKGVTEREFNNFLTAPSIGQYFNMTFRGREM